LATTFPSGCICRLIGNHVPVRVHPPCSPSARVRWGHNAWRPQLRRPAQYGAFAPILSTFSTWRRHVGRRSFSSQGCWGGRGHPDWRSNAFTPIRYVVATFTPISPGRSHPEGRRGRDGCWRRNCITPGGSQDGTAWPGRREGRRRWRRQHGRRPDGPKAWWRKGRVAWRRCWRLRLRGAAGLHLLDLVVDQLLSVRNLLSCSRSDCDLSWLPRAVFVLIDLHLAADGVSHELDVFATLADEGSHPLIVHRDLFRWQLGAIADHRGREARGHCGTSDLFDD